MDGLAVVEAYRLKNFRRIESYTSISCMSALGRLVMVADVAVEEIPVTLFVASRVPFIYMCVGIQMIE